MSASAPKRRSLWKWIGLVVAGSFAFLFLLFGVPACHLLRTWWDDRDERAPTPPGFVDDASRMNQTRVAQTVDVDPDPEKAETQLRHLLDRARAEHLRVAIAGSRHSMGGHTIYPGGIALNMLPFNHLALDARARLLTAGAGARWSEIIPYLDRHGLSVAVMQSNNSFSVGGSLSVNCHGWQPNHGPIASTVESFRLLRPDGTIVRCSRAENAELFSLILGGYGLFGVILDAQLRVVPNELYRPQVYPTTAENYVAAFREQVDRTTDVGLAYGRVNIESGAKTFLREAMLTVFRRVPPPAAGVPALSDPGYRTLRRTLFRGEVGSDYGKGLRWKIEKKVSGQLTKRLFTRNQLLNEGVEVLQERAAARTDILHEYFLPPSQVGPFLARLRDIIPAHKGDLLNVTIRNVKPDTDSFLRYADQEVFGLVLLFSQPRTAEGDARMVAMTRAMIDAALDLGGRYYLPYRLHASRVQFERAYPQARAFFEHKRRLDADELFQNEFYRKYGLP